MFNYSFKILLKRLGLLLLIYQLFRLSFYYFNLSTFEGATLEQTLLAFLHGIRFDLAILFTINLPFIFFSVFPPEKLIQNRKYQKVLLWLYAVLNIPFFFLNIIDIEYYKFIGRRTTNEIFTITQDILDQSGQLFIRYWWFSLILVLLSFALIKLYPKYKEQRPTYLSYFRIQKMLGLAFLIIVCILVIRGGTQYKPLRINHAYVHEPPVLGNLVLNSTFTFFRSINNVPLERKKYFPSQEAIASFVHFDPYKYKNVTEKPVKENVVILIVECLASEYTGIENNGEGFTPFLDSLATQSIFFRRNYANGKRSILALPSILAGLPSLMEEPFISSSYEPNLLYGLGNILEPAGFSTSFFHGGANGTMSFNTFTNKIGIKQYYGLDEYPENWRERDFDGMWGIFDEPYLQYVAAQLNKQKAPFAATIFTLSSHDPYTIPKQYEGKFPKGKIGILEAMAYADYALKQFFKTASKQPWYNNTLFIITGDHTQKTSRKGYNNNFAMHKVPLMLFHPSKKLPKVNTDKITQHADILPTLVDYLNISTDKLLPFGRSVFDTTRTDKAIYSIEAYTALLHRDYITEMEGNEAISIKHYLPHGHGFKRVKKPYPVQMQVYEKELKAYQQYFRNGMIDNNLYYWLTPKK